MGFQGFPNNYHICTTYIHIYIYINIFIYLDKDKLIYIYISNMFINIFPSGSSSVAVSLSQAAVGTSCSRRTGAMRLHWVAGENGSLWRLKWLRGHDWLRSWHGDLKVRETEHTMTPWITGSSQPCGASWDIIGASWHHLNSGILSHFCGTGQNDVATRCWFL